MKMNSVKYLARLFQTVFVGAIFTALGVAAQPSYFPSSYHYPSNSLSLEFAGKSNGTVNLILHGTITGVSYEIVGKQNLTDTWTSQTNVPGATNGTSTAVTVTVGNPDSYFLAARYSSVGGLKLWLAADLSFGTNAIGSVAAWPDLSGNINDAVQNGGSAQPGYVTNSINGFPVVRFDGTDDQLIAPYISGTNNFTIIAVTRTSGQEAIVPESNSGVAGSEGEQYLLFDNKTQDTGNTNNSGAGVSLGDNGVSVFEYQWMPSGPDQTPPQAVFAGSVGTNAVLMSVIYSARQPSIYLNGTLVRVGLASVRTNVFAPREIGGDSYGFFNGDIAEILIFNRSLSDSERGVVETYLNNKYAIAAPGPTIPADLTASTVSSNQINLTWINSAVNAQTFLIERKQGVAGTYQQVATVDVTVTSYMDTGLNTNTQYYYRVRAHNPAGNSGYSNETNATTSATGVSVPLADLKLWYEADAGSVLNNSGQLFQWTDQSGNTNNAIQFTTANEPLYVAGQLNNRPVIRFDGINDQLLAPYIAGTNNFTILVVARTSQPEEIDFQDANGFAGDSGEQYVLGDRTTDMGYTTGGAEISMGTNVISIYEYQRTSSGPDLVPPEAVFSGGIGSGPQIISVVYTNRQPILYLNGSLVQTGVQSTRPTVITPREIGGDPYGYFQGDIAEILIFDRILSNAERLAAENYLNNKYTVVPSLPAPPPGP
jgi:hypothetical protein